MARNSAPKPAWKLAFVLKVKNMQPNVTFDTHKAVKALKSSGFNEKQAESVVETIDKAVNETVATKTDLALQGAKIDALRETVEGIQENMATKADIKDMATKTDIKDMATKTDIKDMATKTDLEAMATKEDLALLADKMATKDDLEKMVTKEELRAELSNLETRMMRMMLLQTTVLVGMLITMIVKLT